MSEEREENPRAELNALGVKYFKTERFKIEKLKGDGSDRKIYLLASEERAKEVVVGVINRNTEENEDFLFIGRKLNEAGIPVPKVYLLSRSKRTYLSQYLGPYNLAESIDYWKRSGQKDKILPAYRKVVKYLVRIQTDLSPVFAEFFQNRPSRKADYCQDLSFFEKNFIVRFGFGKLFSREVGDELRTKLLEPLKSQPANYFVYRDFQSRNIMWLSSSPWFIDYQSALQGSLFYDLASLLYASRSGLDAKSKSVLSRFYFDISPHFSDFDFFEDMLHKFVLIRRLRSLGSYGYLSMEKQKPRFFESIYPSLLELNNLFVKKRSLKFPRLSEVMFQVSEIWREQGGKRLAGAVAKTLR